MTFKEFVTASVSYILSILCHFVIGIVYGLPLFEIQGVFYRLAVSSYSQAGLVVYCVDRDYLCNSCYDPVFHFSLSPN